MDILPLKNPLESRPTLFRVYRSLNIPFEYTKQQWCILSDRVNTTYLKLPDAKLIKVNQKRIFAGNKYKQKTTSYPVSFIPTMILFIEKYNLELKGLPSKPKRKRLTNRVFDLVNFTTETSGKGGKKNIPNL